MTSGVFPHIHEAVRIPFLVAVDIAVHEVAANPAFSSMLDSTLAAGVAPPHMVRAICSVKGENDHDAMGDFTLQMGKAVLVETPGYALSNRSHDHLFSMRKVCTEGVGLASKPIAIRCGGGKQHNFHSIERMFDPDITGLPSPSALDILARGIATDLKTVLSDPDKRKAGFRLYAITGPIYIQLSAPATGIAAPLEATTFDLRFALAKWGGAEPVGGTGEERLALLFATFYAADLSPSSFFAIERAQRFQEAGGEPFILRRSGGAPPQYLPIAETELLIRTSALVSATYAPIVNKTL